MVMWMKGGCVEWALSEPWPLPLHRSDVINVTAAQSSEGDTYFIPSLEIFFLKFLICSLWTLKRLDITFAAIRAKIFQSASWSLVVMSPVGSMSRRACRAYNSLPVFLLLNFFAKKMHAVHGVVFLEEQ